MTRIRTTPAAVPVCLLVLALAVPAAAVAEGGDGKKTFLAQKCNLCHGVPAADIEAKTTSEKMKGPDLGGPLPEEISPEELGAFLRKKSELDGKSHKKEFKGTDEELQTIIDWLGSLEAAVATEAETGGADG